MREDRVRTGEGDEEEKRKKGERYTTSVTTGVRALLLTTNNNREVREEDQKWTTRTNAKIPKYQNTKKVSKVSRQLGKPGETGKRQKLW